MPLKGTNKKKKTWQLQLRKPSGRTTGKAGKDDAAKTSGKPVGKAGKDDAAKNLGEADGEAGQDAHDDDEEDAFVSPEDGPRDRWEARVKALEEEERRGKVGDAHALADGKAVGKPKAGEVESRTTIPRRTKRNQIPMSPDICQMIDDEVEKRVQERMSRSEPRTEVRRQLNFQDEEDYDEAGKTRKGPLHEKSCIEDTRR